MPSEQSDEESQKTPRNKRFFRANPSTTRLTCVRNDKTTANLFIPSEQSDKGSQNNMKIEKSPFCSNDNIVN